MSMHELVMIEKLHQTYECIQVINMQVYLHMN